MVFKDINSQCKITKKYEYPMPTLNLNLTQ